MGRIEIALILGMFAAGPIGTAFAISYQLSVFYALGIFGALWCLFFISITMMLPWMDDVRSHAKSRISRGASQ